MKISTSLFVRLVIKKIIFCSLLTIGIGLYSFSFKNFGDDFLKQLGISKSAADEKITQTLFGSSIDTYGIKNVKNILLGNRSAITKDLLTYTKKHVQSAEFKKQYEAMREKNKPEVEKTKTPEEIKKENIQSAKKFLADTEASLKKADASMKAVFEKLLADGKKQLAEAENPLNKQYVRYEKGYAQLVKDMEGQNQMLLKRWEEQFPANPLLYIKPRLESFLIVTENIDFSAAVVGKGGKKVFVNPEYERKNNQWKMAFRAGKEVVLPAREFVQQWISEIH